MINRHISRTLILLSLVTVFFQLHSQPRGGRFHDSEYTEKIKAMKIAFITDRLSLTPAEAQKFWPVYNQAHNEFNELQEQHMQGFMRDNKVVDLTEEDAARFAENQISRLEKTAALSRKYHEKYLEILPVKKVALLYEAEHDFHRHLFREIRRRNREQSE